jgi:hypothetical protein
MAATSHDPNWSTKQSKLVECKDARGDLTVKMMNMAESNNSNY